MGKSLLLSLALAAPFAFARDLTQVPPNPSQPEGKVVDPSQQGGAATSVGPSSSSDATFVTAKDVSAFFPTPEESKMGTGTYKLDIGQTIVPELLEDTWKKDDSGDQPLMGDAALKIFQTASQEGLKYGEGLDFYMKIMFIDSDSGATVIQTANGPTGFYEKMKSNDLSFAQDPKYEADYFMGQIMKTVLPDNTFTYSFDANLYDEPNGRLRGSWFDEGSEDKIGGGFTYNGPFHNVDNNIMFFGTFERVDENVSPFPHIPDASGSGQSSDTAQMAEGSSMPASGSPDMAGDDSEGDKSDDTVDKSDDTVDKSDDTVDKSDAN